MIRISNKPVHRLWPVGLLCSMIAPVAAHAQESLMVAPVLPDDFNRGRNVSVTERQRPDYDPLGITAGSIIIRPRVQADLGYTSNAYLNESNPKSSAIATVSPDVSATTGWSRHQISVRGGATLRRFIDNSDRNENAYNAAILGRFDATPQIAITGEVQQARIYETPLNGENDGQIAVLSAYDRTFLGLRGEYRSGQGRVLISLDRTLFNFNNIKVASNTVIDQQDRDRAINRITGQTEYAFSPSVSIFGQLSYDDTNYDRSLLLNNDPNRDSEAYRIIAGFNFDMAGLARGTLGAGYTRRDFDAAQYNRIAGLSVEAKVEFFPSELTTYTLRARRIIADSAISNTTAYFDNRASVRVDHELLRNLILNASGEIAYIDYYGSTLHNNVYRASGGARYLINRQFGLETSLSYSSRTSNSTTLGNEFDEFRGQVGLVYQM